MNFLIYISCCAPFYGVTIVEKIWFKYFFADLAK